MPNIEEKVIKTVIDIIERDTALQWDDNTKSIPFEIYADYRDSLSDDTVGEWCQAENPMEKFWDELNNWYEEYCWESENDLLRTVRDNWDSKEVKMEWQEDFVREWIQEHIVFHFPVDHYLQQQVCVDIIVDTGDENYDYVLNDVYPYYDGCYGEPNPKKASIL